MPFAATQMDLEIVILSKSERDKYHMIITYMWNPKYNTNELIYETDTDLQTQRTDLWSPRGDRSGGGWTERVWH